MTVVRIKSTGQVLDMLPRMAAAMIEGGTAEAITDKKIVENAMRIDQGPKAVAAPQSRKQKRERRSA
jgi:hypothetical protein